MAIQTVNLGTAPTGAGGDTFRSTGAKINENFTNLAHAASRMVGLAPDNLVQAWDIRRAAAQINIEYPLPAGWDLNNLTAGDFVFYSDTENPNSPPASYASLYTTRNFSSDEQITVIGHDYFNGGLITRGKFNNSWSQWAKHYHTLNTTVDGNGFIKAASPIVKLFADKIELNDEAKLQEIAFDKLGVGDYLVKGSLGFAQEGWYVETPKDANGNVLFSVIYDTLENGDISFKTYKKKFDLETASIVADLEKPVDITTGRWIDIRLQQLPQPEINHEDLVFESATPAEFQTTNLAQAVAEAFSNGTEQ